MMHTPTETKALCGGTQRKFKFPNGYGASVVRHQFSYGCDEGLFELAVLGPDGRLSYDTPITSDVLGWLTEERVEEALDAIAALPPTDALRVPPVDTTNVDALVRVLLVQTRAKLDDGDIDGACADIDALERRVCAWADEMARRAS